MVFCNVNNFLLGLVILAFVTSLLSFKSYYMTLNNPAGIWIGCLNLKGALLTFPVQRLCTGKNGTKVDMVCYSF